MDGPQTVLVDEPLETSMTPTDRMRRVCVYALIMCFRLMHHIEIITWLCFRQTQHHLNVRLPNEDFGTSYKI